MDAVERFRDKRAAARLSIAFAGTLSVIKLIVGILTHSVSIFASFADSFLDLLTSSANYASISAAEKPADADHAFGHGKAEALAGLVQGILIFGSVLVLVGVSIWRLVVGAEIRQIDLGLIVVGGASVGSLLLTWRLQSVARRTGSLALMADSVHYATDVVTNGGALIALGLCRWSGYMGWDPIISLGMSVYLGSSAWGVLRSSIDILMDRELPEETRKRIFEIVESFRPDVLGCHDLRTRDSGTLKFVEFHMEIRNDVTFERAHAITEEVTTAIRAALPHTEVIIHADPADNPIDPPKRTVDGTWAGA